MAIELEEVTEVKNENVEEKTNGQTVDFADNRSEYDKKMGLLSSVGTRLVGSYYGIDVLDLVGNNLEDGHYSGLEEEIVSCLDIIDKDTEPFVTFDDAFNKLTDQVHDFEIDDKALDQIKYAFCELSSDPITVARKDPAVYVLYEKIKSINGVISNIEFLKDNINKSKKKQVVVSLSGVATNLGIKTVVEDSVEIERSVDRILIKYGLIILDSGSHKDTDEECVVIGNLNMEVDRVKLAQIIDRLVYILAYEESGEEREFCMTQKVRDELNNTIKKLTDIHGNWSEFL